MWNNPFNLAIIGWLGQFTAVSAHFNQLVQYIEAAHLLKGLPVMGVLWFFWFRDPAPGSPNRRIIIASLLGCLLAVVIARYVNNVAPFQPRPFANPALPFHNYIGLAARETQSLYDWNSFPSDHATLFFALATGIFLLSRAAGCAVFLYTLLLIALPRVYLGLHYPTDIIAGALLGIASVILATRPRVIALYDGPCTRLQQRYPAAFQTALFIASAEISMMFIDVRRLQQLLKVLF